MGGNGNVRGLAIRPRTAAANPIDKLNLTYYVRGMQDMAKSTDVPLSRAGNLRKNLRRIFDAGAIQTQVAADAGVHSVHIARILNGDAANPTIGTIESLAIALEIPVETLLSASPSDADLRIFSENPPDPPQVPLTAT